MQNTIITIQFSVIVNTTTVTTTITQYYNDYTVQALKNTPKFMDHNLKVDYQIFVVLGTRAAVRLKFLIAINLAIKIINLS